MSIEHPRRRDRHSFRIERLVTSQNRRMLAYRKVSINRPIPSILQHGADVWGGIGRMVTGALSVLAGVRPAY